MNLWTSKLKNNTGAGCHNGPIFLQTILIPARFRLKGYWSSISAFSSNIIRHIMYIKGDIIKILSRNLIHDNRLLAMIPKNTDPWQDHPVKNCPNSGSSLLSLNRDRDHLQKYWANDSLHRVMKSDDKIFLAKSKQSHWKQWQNFRCAKSRGWGREWRVSLVQMRSFLQWYLMQGHFQNDFWHQVNDLLSL